MCVLLQQYYLSVFLADVTTGHKYDTRSYEGTTVYEFSIREPSEFRKIVGNSYDQSQTLMNCVVIVL